MVRRKPAVADANGEQHPVDAPSAEPHTPGALETPPEAAAKPRPVASWRFPVDRSTTVQATLWPNLITLQSGEQVEVLSLTLGRSYRDKDGDWVNARMHFSFRTHELPVLMHALAKAYGFAMDQRQQDPSM